MSRKSYFLLGAVILTCLVLGSGRDNRMVTAQQSSAATIEPYMVKDINPVGDSDPKWFTEMGGKIYFSAFTEGHQSIWVEWQRV